MTDFLFKVFVGRFYKLNTGFFLFFFLLFFGIMTGKDAIAFHYAIMQAIGNSVFFTGIALAVWTLYNFKCISYFLKEINLPENSFLFHLQALSDREQFWLLLSCQAAVYFPALLYAGITAMVGFSGGHVLSPVIIIVYQLLMCAAGAALYFNRLNSTWKTPVFQLPSLNIFPKKTFCFYLIYYSLYYRKATFIAVKLFSLLLLQIMVIANSEKVSREAICFLMLFLISAHSLLPLFYVQFIEGELTFLRNLPLPLMRRFGVYVFTYAIIFLPELLFLLWNERAVLPPQAIFSLYALAVAQLSLYTALQYFKKMTTERYTTIVVVLFFMSLLLLASFNLWFLFFIEAVVAVVLFAGLYYGYEVAEKSS